MNLRMLATVSVIFLVTGCATTGAPNSPAPTGNSDLVAYSAPAHSGCGSRTRCLDLRTLPAAAPPSAGRQALVP
jgi:hypothetical protein